MTSRLSSELTYLQERRHSTLVAVYLVLSTRTLSGSTRAMIFSVINSLWSTRCHLFNVEIRWNMSGRNSNCVFLIVI
jgi:hypothetical protein